MSDACAQNAQAASSCASALDLIFQNDKRSVKNVKWQRRAFTQILLLAGCYFSTIGMWNSLNGIGGLGTGDEQLAGYCNTALYIAGVVGGAVAGGVVNIVGVRVAVLVGVAGIASIILSYYLYYYEQVIGLWATAIYNGVASITASCLTCAIGTALVHYPTGSERNFFISIVSIILNIGGLSGALMSFALNRHILDEEVNARALNRSSYVTIVIIAFSGLICGGLLLDYDQVVRSDGTVPHVEKKSVKNEVLNLLQGFKDLNIYLLGPLFMASIWHEVVLFNFLNTQLFNVRSRALNAACYYLARILASSLFHKFVDRGKTLKAQVHLALTILSIFLAIGITALGCVFGGVYGLKDESTLDLLEPRALIATTAFFAYGGLETMCSSYIFWLLGVLPLGDCNKKNRYVGWSRTFINIGGASSWMLDTVSWRPPYAYQWGINIFIWVLALNTSYITYKRTTRAKDQAEVSEFEIVKVDSSRSIITPRVACRQSTAANTTAGIAQSEHEVSTKV